MPPIARQQRKLVPGYTRHPGSIWIDKHRADLPNDEWAAANQDRLVAHDSTIDGLMVKIQAQQIDLADVAIAFITLDSV